MDESVEFQAASLHDRLAARVREMIISGQLRPGDPIAEMELCGRFGVSRTPLREALKVLAVEGLVDLLPRRGARISIVRAEDVAERFEMVRLIETHAADWVCRHADDAAIASLRALQDSLVSAQDRGDPVNYFQANEGFHRALVELTGNRVMIEIHASLVAHLRRARFQGMDRSHVGETFVDEHETVVQRLEARDCPGAMAAIRQHHVNVEHDTLAMLRGHRGRPDCRQAR